MEVKIYETGSAKVLDFMIGFFIIGGLLDSSRRFLSKLMNADFLTAFLIATGLAGLALSIYLYGKRKYMGIGLFFAVVVGPLMVFGTYFLVGLGMSSH